MVSRLFIPIALLAWVAYLIYWLAFWPWELWLKLRGRESWIHASSFRS